MFVLVEYSCHQFDEPAAHKGGLSPDSDGPAEGVFFEGIV